MRIRPAITEDCEAIAALIASFQPLLTLDPTGVGAEEYLSSVSVEAERRYLESTRYCYTVAEQDSRLVGFIAIRDETHIFHLFVAGTEQRKGVARALWEEARKKSAGANSPALFTVNSSLNAIPVYQRFGFIAESTVLHKHGIAYLPMKAIQENAA